MKERMDDLSLLKLFVLVAEVGSFSAAARVTNTTPSAVSRQISRLEQDLGARLLQRSTRRQNLTEAGEVLLVHARQVVEDLEAARLAVSNLNSAPRGILRITAEADLAATFLAPLLPEFLERYPDLKLRLLPSASMEDLVDRNIDVAIRMGHLQSSTMIARRLTTSRSVLVASPSYLERRGVPQRPDDLRSHACLSFRADVDQTVWRFEAAGEQAEIGISPRLQAPSLLVLKNAAKAGMGIAMLPRWMMEEDLGNGALVPILTEYALLPSKTPISAVYASGRNLASKVRVFIDFLGERMG
ncbi:LysR family transcriptional regulator [Donghicola sp.]|uniref:LysR family transcriptional regulator n=1 Tax=Donghicola sp. TaxID=1929294 RepID=UPI0025F19F6D|nr:LysR family transcriptional regulator [Donghicola sp.]MCT4578927.1 LysR family transcriptional regulator [Donghicola sp.]